MPGCPTNQEKDDNLKFESRFESGNLAKVVKITETYYELYLRTDMYTNRHMQWFYFRIQNTKKHIIYRYAFQIIERITKKLKLNYILLLSDFLL